MTDDVGVVCSARLREPTSSPSASATSALRTQRLRYQSARPSRKAHAVNHAFTDKPVMLGEIYVTDGVGAIAQIAAVELRGNFTHPPATGFR
jgi:hypothetical protein